MNPKYIERVINSFLNSPNPQACTAMQNLRKKIPDEQIVEDLYTIALAIDKNSGVKNFIKESNRSVDRWLVQEFKRLNWIPSTKTFIH